MKHSPSWETKSFSASPEIPRLLWKPKVHYCIYNFPPPVPINDNKWSITLINEKLYNSRGKSVPLQARGAQRFPGI